MKCEHCGKNPATVQTKISVNGQVTEQMLCAQCWSEQNLKFAQPYTLNDLFKGIFESVKPHNPALSCPVCKMDLRTFRKTGLLGCPECYEVFAEVLEPNLIKIHGKAHHEGKQPAGHVPGEPAPAQAEIPEKQPKADPQSELRIQLKAAIEAEDYERAATLRDKIKALSAPAGGNGNE